MSIARSSSARCLSLGLVAVGLAINACESETEAPASFDFDGGVGIYDAAAYDGANTDDGGQGPSDSGIGDSGETKPDASTLACAEGTGDCDLDPANGCEVTFANNPAHCGRCGRDCTAAGSTCQVDKCAAVPLYTNTGISGDNSGARSFAFGNASIYHVGYNSYAVRRFPVDGSGITTVWAPASKTAGIESLAVTSTSVVWAERGSPSAMLGKAFTADSSALPDVLFEPEYQPSYVVIAGTTMYWASGDYQSGNPGGYIYSRPLSAASTVKGDRIVTTDQGNHGAIVAMTVSSDAIYWATRGDGQGDYEREIRTAPLAGGTATTIPAGVIVSYPLYNSVELRSVGDTLFYNRNNGASALNGIYRYRPGDAAPTRVVADSGVTSFVIADDTIYYAILNNQAVYAAPVTGGQGKMISATGGGLLVGVDTKLVYSSAGTTMFKIVR